MKIKAIGNLVWNPMGFLCGRFLADWNKNAEFNKKYKPFNIIKFKTNWLAVKYP